MSPTNAIWKVDSQLHLPEIEMQVLKTQLEAKAKGYADVVYLDAVSDTYLEEVSSCNVFTVKGKTIKTPPLHVRRFYFAACLHPCL